MKSQLTLWTGVVSLSDCNLEAVTRTHFIHLGSFIHPQSQNFLSVVIFFPQTSLDGWRHKGCVSQHELLFRSNNGSLHTAAYEWWVNHQSYVRQAANDEDSLGFRKFTYFLVPSVWNAAKVPPNLTKKEKKRKSYFLITVSRKKTSPGLGVSQCASVQSVHSDTTLIFQPPHFGFWPQIGS